MSYEHLCDQCFCRLDAKRPDRRWTLIGEAPESPHLTLNPSLDFCSWECLGLFTATHSGPPQGAPQRHADGG